MTLETIELCSDTHMTGLAKLPFTIDRNILPAAVFRRVAGHALIQTEIRGTYSLAHGLVTLMVQIFHVIASHIVRIRDTVFQLGSARARHHFRETSLGETQTRKRQQPEDE